MPDPAAPAPAPNPDPNPAPAAPEPAPAPAPVEVDGNEPPPAEPAAAPAGEPDGDPAVHPDPALAPAAPPAAPAAAKTPWFQQRIGVLTKQFHETKNEADRLAQENAELRARVGGAPPAPAPAPSAATHMPLPTDPRQIEQLVNQQAQRLVAEQQFNQRCNTVFEQGVKEVPGFQEAVKNFEMVGGLAQAPAFVEAVTLIPDGHKVLAHLGQNLEEAQRVMSLPPVQQAMELTKLSNRLAAAPRQTNAPAPLKPVTPGASPVAGPDDDGNFADQASYDKWREKNFKKR